MGQSVTLHNICSLSFFAFGAIKFFHDVIHVQGLCTLWCIPPLCAIQNDVSSSQISVGVQFNLGIISPPPAPSSVCGYFLGLLLSSSLISGGGGGGTDSVVLGLTSSLLGGLHWSHSSLLLNWCWLALIPQLPWVVVCDHGLVFPEFWIPPCWVTPSWVSKLVGSITGQFTLSPSNEILESWIGCSWCWLNSNTCSSNTPTRVILRECNGCCWCGLDLNWCSPSWLIALIAFWPEAFVTQQGVCLLHCIFSVK